MMFGLGVPELLIIGLIVGLMFGGKRVKGLLTGVGESIRELRKGLKENQDAD